MQIYFHEQNTLTRDRNLTELNNFINNSPMQEIPSIFLNHNKAILELRRITFDDRNFSMLSEIHKKMLDFLPKAMVIRVHPNQSWIHIFKNINHRNLSSVQKSVCFNFVHGKIAKKELLYRQKRVSSQYYIRSL